MSNLLSIHKSMLMINNKIVVEIILFESIIKIIFTYFVMNRNDFYYEINYVYYQQ